jgi:hypothetical protein
VKVTGGAGPREKCLASLGKIGGGSDPFRDPAADAVKFGTTPDVIDHVARLVIRRPCSGVRRDHRGAGRVVFVAVHSLMAPCGRRSN